MMMNPGKIVTFYVSLGVCRFWWQSVALHSNTLVSGEANGERRGLDI